MHRRAVPVHLLAALLILPSCGIEQKGGVRPPSPARGTEGGGASSYPFSPVAIVIHPLTRLVVDRDSRTRIDAHIEFRDAAGDEVKGAGRLVLELYRESGPVTGMGGREQLLRWETDLTDARANSNAYDRVTRTYRFELTGVPANAASGRSLVLRAVLMGSGSRPLEDEAVIGR